LNAAVTEKLLTSSEADELLPSAEVRVGNPGYLPDSPADQAFDEKLARFAATVALRRHARPHDSGSVRYAGKDLRNATVVVGSGGVLRHATRARASAIIRTAIDDRAGGWRVPERARVVIDQMYVLAAAGLLATSAPEAAARLLQAHLETPA
jgi:uncharacterized protein (TIGR01319 family)